MPSAKRPVECQASRYGYVTSRAPLVLSDALRAARVTGPGDSNRANALLALAYQSAVSVLTKLGEADLAWIASERGMHAAQQSDNPVVLGSLFRSVAHACSPSGSRSTRSTPTGSGPPTPSCGMRAARTRSSASSRASRQRSAARGGRAVGPVTRCDVRRRREAEANLLTGLFSVPCGAGFLGAVWPAVRDAIGTTVVVLLAALAGLALLRVLVRRVREWREDRTAPAAARAPVRRPG
jgi:hypothetical protein